MEEHSLIKFCNTKCLSAKDSFLNKNISKNFNKFSYKNFNKSFNKNIYENFNENFDKTIDKFDSNGLFIIRNFDDSRAKISHLHNNTNRNWNERVKCDTRLNSHRKNYIT